MLTLYFNPEGCQVWQNTYNQDTATEDDARHLCIIDVVDYDKARWQPRVVEVAEALICFASPRLGHMKRLVYPGFLNWESLACFLHHYGRAMTLEENEVRALPDYVRCI